MARKQKLFLGPRIRRLRRARGLTQAELAGAIGVSPSYINLMERNQRPVSADVLVSLARAFDFDIAALDDDSADDLFADVNKALADPLFRDAGVTREDAQELAAGNPVLAEAVAQLYRAWRGAEADLIELRASGRSGIVDPVDEARRFIQDRRNFFPAIDAAGEALAREIDLLARGGVAAISDHLETAHHIRVRIMPDEVMVGALRRLNRHSRELMLSERLDQASRAFHLALQLRLIDSADAIDRTVNDAPFETDAGRRLARNSVANYAAAALLMPYGPFLTAASDLRYDIEAIARRFGASFEQVAHRLTTLQRDEARGVPFFFLRVDPAGNISKRFSADVFPFARFGGSCPLWNVHDCFRAPRRILTQIIELPDGGRYFSIARTVHAGVAGYGAPQAERAVALGCRLEDAGKLIYADGNRIEATPATPIGVTCRLCERPDCAARAFPPLHRKLLSDDTRRQAAPFSFAFE